MGPQATPPATGESRATTVRVAVFLPETAAGGVERVMTALAGGLVEAGFGVDLVVATGTGELSGVPDGVRVVPLGAARTASALCPLTRYLRDAPVAALITAKDYATLVALAARRRSGRSVPVIATVHAPPSEAWATTARRSGRALRPLLRRYLARADRIVAVSAGVADDLRTLLGAERTQPSQSAPDTAATTRVRDRRHRPAIDVVPNPVLDPAFFAAAAGAPPDGWLVAPRPIPVVVFCGRLSSEKDPLAAIAAFDIVRRGRPLRMLIAGDGPERAAVAAEITRRRLADHVRMLGHVEPSAPYLAHADVCVLSSRTEGMPTVAVEALALGTPVVATATASGVRELIGNGSGGRLAPVGDTAALAAAIIAELDAPSAPLDRSALAPFTVNAATERYARILGELGVVAAPATRPTTALCILTRDRPAALDDALASASGFDETIVVDMASEPALEPRPGVVWRREGANLGVTRGRNLLVKLATADVVVFLDDDAVFLTGDGPAIADAFAREPALGALAFLIRRADGRVESAEWPFRGAPRDIERPRPAAYFLGGACAVRRDAFLAAGGYDESFFYSTEEIDLAFALTRNAYAIEYTPDIVVEHRPSASGRVANPALPGLRLRNRIVFARRYLPAPIAFVHVGAWGARTAREAASEDGWSGWRAAWREGRTATVERRPLPYGVLTRLHHAGGRVFW